MRCYNGCPDKQLQSVIDSKSRSIARVREIEPTAKCIYFHPHHLHSHGYGVYRGSDFKFLSGFHGTFIGACEEALCNLKGENTK